MVMKARKHEFMKSVLPRLAPAVLATLCSLAALGLAGCASKPALKQVSIAATDKPINTPEAAQALVQRYGR
jgi:hypothetical protein